MVFQETIVTSFSQSEVMLTSGSGSADSGVFCVDHEAGIRRKSSESGGAGVLNCGGLEFKLSLLWDDPEEYNCELPKLFAIRRNSSSLELHFRAGIFPLSPSSLRPMTLFRRNKTGGETQGEQPFHHADQLIHESMRKRMT